MLQEENPFYNLGGQGEIFLLVWLIDSLIQPGLYLFFEELQHFQTFKERHIESQNYLGWKVTLCNALLKGGQIK